VFSPTVAKDFFFIERWTLDVGRCAFESVFGLLVPWKLPGAWSLGFGISSLSFCKNFFGCNQGSSSPQLTSATRSAFVTL
jgi:hypothetical protein